MSRRIIFFAIVGAILGIFLILLLGTADYQFIQDHSILSRVSLLLIPLGALLGVLVAHYVEKRNDSGQSGFRRVLVVLAVIVVALFIVMVFLPWLQLVIFGKG
jgi:hypothetical protein